MPIQALVDAVTSMRGQGFSPVQIRQMLQSQGWQSKDIEEVFSNPNPLPLLPIKARSWGVLAVVALLVITLIAVMVYIVLPKPTGQLLDVSVHPISLEVMVGSQLDFIVELTNLGSSRRFDVVVKSELVSVSSNEVVVSKSDTVAIETRNALRSQLLVPHDVSPGRYVVRTMVEYDRQVARASFSLKVLPAKMQEVVRPDMDYSCQGGCNDYDPCTNDQCRKSVCVHDKVSPCCGNRVCESSESSLSCQEDCEMARLSREVSVERIISSAVDKSGSDIDAGVRLCKTLSLLSDHDACLAGVAKRSGEPAICDQIVSESQRDSCFLDIALGRDRFDMCEKVVDRWLKSSCFSYQRLKSAGR